jgi:hypothetical protein
MPGKKKIVMTVSEKGYKNFQMIMKKLGFSNEDMFLNYCALSTIKRNLKKIKPDATISEKKRIDKEIKQTIKYGKKK